MSEPANGRGLEYRVARNERDIERHDRILNEVRAEQAAMKEEQRIRNEWRNRNPVLWISGLSMAAAILMAILQIIARFGP